MKQHDKRERCRKCGKRRFRKYLWYTLNLSKRKIEYECYNCNLEYRKKP